MRALSIIAIVIAAVLIGIGILSRQGSGAVLSNAVIIGGVLVLLVVAGSWIAMFVKSKQQ